MADETASDGWWTERAIGDGLSWEIGPLSLYIDRRDGEWLVAHEEKPANAEAEGWSVEPIAAIPEELGEVARFAFNDDSQRIRLCPRPADRSVVARPRAPLHVLAGEEARFFVSAPVWIEVLAGSSARSLCEVPTRRLSDTWFGASTRDGEVAYGLKTHARADLPQLPRPAHRAITPVRIANRGNDSLPLDRMNLPVPYLSIYADANAVLWTEAVTLLRGEHDEMATFEIGNGPPPEARDARQISEPRTVSAGSPLVRAFGLLLRPFQEED